MTGERGVHPGVQVGWIVARLVNVVLLQLKGELAGFCRRLQPGLDVDAVDWRPVSRAGLRRGFVRYLVLSLVAAGAAGCGARPVGLLLSPSSR